MAEHTLILPTLHPGQVTVRKEMKRFNIVACGRRWGKTTFAERLAIETAINKLPVAWSAPKYKNLREPFKRILRRLKKARLVERSSASELVIELITGGSVKFWTHEDEDLGRGEFYALWIDDEAAHSKGLGEHFEKAILPTLTDLDGVYLAISTPNGKSGAFYEMYRRGQDEAFEDWASWQLETITNPTIKNLADFLERAKAQMIPAHYRQEYLAQFEQPAGAVFDCWSEANVIQPFSDQALGRVQRVYHGWDFGSANTARVTAVKNSQGDILIVDEYYASGDDAGKHVLMCSRWSNKDFLAFGGAPSEDGWRKRFGDAGHYIRRPSEHELHVGIATVYGLIRDKKLKVCANCTKLIEQLETYAYKMDGEGRLTDLIEDKSMYHLIDAVRYLCVSVTEDTQIRIYRGEPTAMGIV